MTPPRARSRRGASRAPRPAARPPLRRSRRLATELRASKSGVFTFAGGCFFYSATAGFDARPGRVRDEIAHHLRRWRHRNVADIEEVMSAGEIAGDTDPGVLAFELDAYARAGGGDALLHDDPEPIGRARTAMLARLRAVATDPSLLPES